MTDTLFDLPGDPEIIDGRGPRPDPIAARMVAAGLLDPAVVASRTARPRYCAGCRELVWRGVDAEASGMVVACDPSPLDRLGEILAVLERRATFSLSYRGRWELNDRMTADIQAGNPRNADILVEHSCHPSGTQLSRAQSRVRAPVMGEQLPDAIPF